jgi:hypothetical protein
MLRCDPDFCFVLSPDGASAVETQGAKYPSALWLVQPCGQRDGATLARPFKLLSVGLTARPNISGVESLANARGGGNFTEENEVGKEPMKLIAGWLLARGVALANSETPTETEVLTAIQKHFTELSGRETALVTAKGQRGHKGVKPGKLNMRLTFGEEDIGGVLTQSHLLIRSSAPK